MSLTIAAPNGKRFQVKTADVEDEPARNDEEINGGLNELNDGADVLRQLREEKLETENKKQQVLTDRAMAWKQKLEQEIDDRQVQNDNLKKQFEDNLEKGFQELSTICTRRFDAFEEKILDPERVDTPNENAAQNSLGGYGQSRPGSKQSTVSQHSRQRPQSRLKSSQTSVQPPDPPPKDGPIPLEMRVRIVNTDFEHFRDVEVPEKRDNETGKIERTLKKYQESFDIDNAKLVKREEKIKERLAEFKHATKNSFDDEKMTRKYKYLEILENLDDISRKEDRESERLHTDIVLDLAEEQKRLKETVEMRAATDTEIVENIKSSMQRMQSIVLKHFGLNRNKKSSY